MTERQLHDELRELAWRRTLTAAEENRLRAWLAAHPEDAADWEAELILTQGLSRLPDVPVPSNFTTVVVQRARHEATAKARPSTAFLPKWWRISWAPRLGFAAVVLAVGVVSYLGVQQAQREHLVHGVEVVTEVAAVPSPEVLKDFDAIRALSRAPAPDEELLRLMQ